MVSHPAFCNIQTAYPVWYEAHYVFFCGGNFSVIFLELEAYTGTTVAEVLCYKSEGRWIDPTGVIGLFIDIKSFRSQYGPGFDSTSNRKEYQEYFLGIKAAGG